MTGRVSDTFPAAGLLAARPADPGCVPGFYSATDEGVVYRWDGSTWTVWALALPEGGTDGYVPKWNDAAGLWVPAAETGGGGGGDASWTTATLAGAWVNFGAPYPNASFRKLADGTVLVRGLVKSGAIGTTIFTLPVGYRPVGQLIRPSSTGSSGTNVIGNLTISDAGAVVPTAGGNTYFGLDAVFYAEG